jgi:PAS domain S-box-containing protein
MIRFEILNREVPAAAHSARPTADIPVSLAEIHQINSLIGADSENVDLYNSLSGILRRIGSVIEFSKAAVFTIEPGAPAMTCRASCGMSLKQVKAAELEIGGNVTEALRRRQMPFFPLSAGTDGPAASGPVLIAPIRYNGTFRGILHLTSPSHSVYGQKEAHLLSLVSRQLAMLFETQSLKELGPNRPERCERLLDQAGIALFSISGQGQFMRANRGLLDLLGYSDEGELRDVNFFIHVMNPRSAACRLKDLLPNNETVDGFTASVNRCDGSVVPVTVHTRAIRDASGVITGHECVARERTAGETATDEIIQLQKMVSLGQLTSGAAHDFNNLVAGIMACASMVLSDTDPKTPLYGDIQAILTAARKAGDLSSQLLAYGREETRSKSVSLNELISESLDMIERTCSSEIVIRRSLFPHLSAVEGDAARLRQALMALCINARDAMPEGGVLTVETENICLDGETAAGRFGVEPGPYAMVRIRDTGRGMGGRAARMLLEPDFRVRENDGGNGLGLFIAREIAGRHRGGIAVSSAAGRGTTLEVVLPELDEPAAAAPEIERSCDLPGGTETLLFVDDEEVVRRVGKRMLERFGYRVLMAKNGSDALKTLKGSDTDIDLLIVDKTMPHMDGPETLRKIRQIKPGVRALLTSGYTGDDFQDELSVQGFCGFIPKPFLAGQMLKLIRQSLDGARVVFQ